MNSCRSPARFRLITGPTLLTACILLLTSSLQAAEIIEEITITGDENPDNLTLAVEQAENQFYTLFNQLVDDRDYQVSCKKELLLGSRIKQRVCQTRYMQEALSSAAVMRFSDSPYDANAKLIQKNVQFRQKTQELIEQNPALREAAANLADRVADYKDKYHSGN